MQNTFCDFKSNISSGVKNVTKTLDGNETQALL